MQVPIRVGYGWHTLQYLMIWLLKIFYNNNLLNEITLNEIPKSSTFFLCKGDGLSTVSFLLFLTRLLTINIPNDVTYFIFVVQQTNCDCRNFLSLSLCSYLIKYYFYDIIFCSQFCHTLWSFDYSTQNNIYHRWYGKK